MPFGPLTAKDSARIAIQNFTCDEWERRICDGQYDTAHVFMKCVGQLSQYTEVMLDVTHVDIFDIIIPFIRRYIFLKDAPRHGILSGLVEWLTVTYAHHITWFKHLIMEVAMPELPLAVHQVYHFPHTGIYARDITCDNPHYDDAIIDVFHEFNADPTSIHKTFSKLVDFQRDAFLRASDEEMMSMGPDFSDLPSRIIPIFVDEFEAPTHDDAWEQRMGSLSKYQFLLRQLLEVEPDVSYITEMGIRMLMNSDDTDLHLPIDTQLIKNMQCNARSASYEKDIPYMCRIITIARHACTSESLIGMLGTMNNIFAKAHSSNQLSENNMVKYHNMMEEACTKPVKRCFI